MSIARLSVLYAILATANALPQAINPTSSSSSNAARSSITSGLVGTFSSVGPAPTTSLSPNFSIPDQNPTNPQNTSDLPSTPIGPTIPDLPTYALDYAPVVYLADNESYWPSDMEVHLNHVFPWENYQAMGNVPRPLTLENLNFTLSTSLYLSTDNPAVEPRPDWYYSEYGRPDASGYSAGNITIICINKTESIEPGVVDVFYFLFYSFNDGQNVGGQTYGNHISDIEHLMIRFYSGEPRYLFMSAHEDGNAYEWQALQKEGARPIVYSAIGGHAHYAVAGSFEQVPGLVGLLEDNTSAGTRWDLIKNYNGYWASQAEGFIPANGTNATTRADGRPPGVGYLQQTGKWGNQALRRDDPNQQIIFGQQQWSDGATGPYDPSKALLRTWLCVQSDCRANASLPASSAPQAGEIREATSDGARAFGEALFLPSAILATSAIALLF